jgi:hypothetical protein
MEARVITHTNSSLSCFRTCRYQYWLRYVLGLRRIRKSDALRWGEAFDAGVSCLTNPEHQQKGYGIDEAVAIATSGYDVVPQWTTAEDWAIERMEVEMCLRGWAWRYAEQLPFFIGSQRILATSVGRKEGCVSRCWIKGKADAMIDWPPPRHYLFELKTTSESLEDDADYWTRLRSDPQLSIYSILLDAIGERPDGILYNVVRKPTIGPLLIPLLDSLGRKIVMDEKGDRVFNQNGTPRQCASKEDGWALQSLRQTPEEYGKRLLEDIGAQPDKYFAQREIARHDDELDRVKLEVVQEINEINACHRNGRWYRSPGRMTCDHCEYSAVCLGKPSLLKYTQDQDLPPCPEGFEYIINIHPELEIEDAKYQTKIQI